MNNFDNSELNAVATSRGASITASDSDHDILRKWCVAEGGTPLPLDSRCDVLRKIAIARGVTPKPGDSLIQILQRIAGLGSGHGVSECLRHLKEPTETPYVNVPVLTAAPGGVVNWVDTHPAGFTQIQFEIAPSATGPWSAGETLPTTDLVFYPADVWARGRWFLGTLPAPTVSDWSNPVYAP